MGEDKNTLVIDTELTNLFENEKNFSSEAFKFFIGIVVLHELTHYGDFHYNGDMYQELEEGNAFQFVVTGYERANPEDATKIFKGYLLRKKQ